MAVTGRAARRGPDLIAAAGVVQEVFLRPVALIAFVQQPLLGAALWLVLLLQPGLALAAALALAGMELANRAFGLLSAGARIEPADRANGLLAALAAAWIFLPGPQAPALKAAMIAGTVAAGLLFSFFARDLLARSRLPALVWPYCLVAFALFTLFPDAPARSLAHFGWPLFAPEGIAGLADSFLRSLGVFLFSPWPLSGLLIGAAVLAWSPAMFLAGVAGWLSGVAVSAALVAAGMTFYWASASYNFFLAGMTLGAVFFAPDLRGFLFALIGGALAALFAAVLQVLLAYSAASFLPIPFALALYMGLVLLAAPPFGRPDDRLAAWTRQPEANRIARDWTRARWGRPGTPLVGIPMSGVLEVTQGFDAGLSHKGAWRHALDFQHPRNDPGDEDSRPSVWAETVYAPVSGEVVAVTQSVPDNPLGAVNYAQNWGNHVVLRTDAGGHVLLGHLLQGSVTVRPGERVDNATRLGLAGNSGRSPVPHLHLQAQAGPRAGAPTRDFRLANYLICARDTRRPVEWRASGHAAEGTLVMAATPNAVTRSILSGMLPGRGVWTVSHEGPGAARGKGQAGPVILETTLLEDGSRVIGDGRGARMVAALEFDGLRLTALEAPAAGLVPWLALCLSSIPYAAFPGLAWRDWQPRGHGWAVPRALARLNPLAGAGLAQVSLRCEAIGVGAEGGAEAGAASGVASGAEGTFAIVATLGAEGAGDRVTCRATLAALRGPVELIVRQGAGTTVFKQISFQPHEV